MVSDLVLFPHCDLHMVVNAAGAPQLKLQVFNRSDPPAGSTAYTMNDFTSQCTYDFFAPHNAKGSRFANLPTVAKTGGNIGLVTATTPGVYLFQITLEQHYIVGRLQVHKQFDKWWFGNDSITTAVDATIGHSQPSIYASFIDDLAPGTDVVGDITGHGYVNLTSTDTSKVVIAPRGRLRGVAETTAAVNISGTFPIFGSTLGPPQTLPVRVVDYAKPHRDLLPVQTPDIPHADTMHNILVLAEGFKDTPDDRQRFDEIVTRAVQRDLLDKPRHEPYPMLEGSFNLFKTFTVSQENAVTCGYRVTDTEAAGIKPGLPIPYLRRPPTSGATKYTLRDLVLKVGLPKNAESRTIDQLKTDWGSQNLDNFDVTMVDDPLIEAWKAHQSVGILHARDTFLGLHLGSRLADRLSGAGPVTRPANDDASDQLKAFVKRVYEFYRTAETRLLTPDPRRHPPELFAGNNVNAGSSLMRYIASLQYAFAPFQPIGQQWMADSTKFKPSRGLVAIVTHDDVTGGANTNDNSFTTTTFSRQEVVAFAYASATDRQMRRTPATIVPDYAAITNVISHEFGHSFNLGDEYESFGGDDTSNTTTDDFNHDNVSRLAFLRLGAAPSREVDADKVKWFKLPRAEQSARLVAPSQDGQGGIVVKINPVYAAKWADADSATVVNLRNFNLAPAAAQTGQPRRVAGQQLPFRSGEEVTGLKIGNVDKTTGTILLTGGTLPANPPFPKFAAGSAMYVPKLKGSDQLLVVEKEVLNLVKTVKVPINLDPDTTQVNDKPDLPGPVPGMSPPCQHPTLVGIYEGASYYAGGHYRPTGTCKMRSIDAGEEFCFICRWLLVNRVDPTYHSLLDWMFYPKAKN